ncbi:MAG: protein phosphatase 2C domain-containing protein [Ruminococcus sp.]|nr:protein phosphatase 2C domain-containing protein [Ruminococcus sp.]
MGTISDFFDMVLHKNIGKQTVRISYASNVGKVRTKNEDDLFIDGLGTRAKENMAGNRILNHSERYVFAVCDGMGGEQFGDEASSIAARTIAHFSYVLNASKPADLSDNVNALATEANNRISGMVYAKRANLSGSTLVMACLRKNMAYIFNLGDSRAYFCKGGVLRQITDDHTVARRKVKSDIISENEAKSTPDSHKLTTFLGIDTRWIGLKAQSYEPIDIRSGVLLLCSDGLSDMCSEAEITEILSGEHSNSAERLVNKAIENGGQDNITCIVIKI